MRDAYATQIFRVDGKNTFLEALNVAFPIKKLQINFIEYDPAQNNKQTKKLDIYMDILQAVALSERILSGEFASMVEKAKAANKFAGSPITPYTSFFTDMGGISEEKVAKNFDSLKERYPFLQKGQAISRQLKIQTGSKYPWVLRAEYGPGQSSDKGLIVPQGNAPIFINIPIDSDSFFKMAVAIKYSYQAYLNQYYAKYADQLFPSDGLKVFDSQTHANNNFNSAPQRNDAYMPAPTQRPAQPANQQNKNMYPQPQYQQDKGGFAADRGPNYRK